MTLRHKLMAAIAARYYYAGAYTGQKIATVARPTPRSTEHDHHKMAISKLPNLGFLVLAQCCLHIAS
jgi:hypothetical protein